MLVVADKRFTGSRENDSAELFQVAMHQIKFYFYYSMHCA